jgi:hypothetical protein
MVSRLAAAQQQSTISTTTSSGSFHAVCIASNQAADMDCRRVDTIEPVNRTVVEFGHRSISKMFRNTLVCFDDSRCIICKKRCEVVQVVPTASPIGD